MSCVGQAGIEPPLILCLNFWSGECHSIQRSLPHLPANICITPRPLSEDACLPLSACAPRAHFLCFAKSKRKEELSRQKRKENRDEHKNLFIKITKRKRAAHSTHKKQWHILWPCLLVYLSTYLMTISLLSFLTLLPLSSPAWWAIFHLLTTALSLPV